MSKFVENVLKIIQECGCGVTTGSFAPAVTNTIYPRPGKKQTTFRKKAEDVLDELTPEQMDDLYSDNDEDSSEQYWPDWSKNNWDEYNKNQQLVNDNLELIKNKFYDKYKARNDAYAKKLDGLYQQYLQDPDVDPIALDNYFQVLKRQLIRAIIDCNKYKKMSGEEFSKLNKPKMKPIKTKVDYFRIRKYDPLLD